MQLDDLEVDTTAIVGEFCFGDGPSAVCPCGNQSVSGRGCANSVGSDGGRLFATGSASLGAGDLRLHAEGLPAGELVVFASGSVAPLSSPVLVADGLRCLSGPLRRVEVALASSTGVASTLQLPALAEGLLAGDARHYQAWYRDALASPCGGGANFTQGVSVQWVP